ncbi:hypothetical protein DB30_06534 [Enhygromyxa salina]|uniref:Uncharacterized protein n=1 Tax=Enhygromyxa salina TaxID=215803 RepID=A0A0C2A6C0_9BACT|nr:hypothetical protein DB30_06534 [Enhygromyxa salina]
MLEAAEGPSKRRAQDECRMRSASVGDALTEFVDGGAVVETELEYRGAR